MKQLRSLGVGLALLAGVMPVLATTPSGAQDRGPIACGAFYTVVRGDTLHRIAVRAYDTGNYAPIFEANRSFLRSASLIEIGDRLLIPCLDGSGFRTRDEAMAALGQTHAPGASAAARDAGEAAPSQAAGSAPSGPFARILVLAEAAPLAGRRLPEGGMITELVSRAMLRAPAPVDYEVVFPEGDALRADAIGNEGFDLGFPVARPDCARAAGLPAEQGRLCSEFLFSDPLMDIETRVFVRAGDKLASATDPQQFRGLKACRPVGTFTGDLGVEGLASTDVTLVRAARARDCFAELGTGAADIVILGGPDLARVMAATDLGASVVEIVALRRSRSLHVVAPRGNLRGQAFLTTLNRGLAELRESGEWTAVVGNHLAFQARGL